MLFSRAQRMETVGAYSASKFPLFVTGNAAQKSDSPSKPIKVLQGKKPNCL
jgi:hypothetical protein